MPHERGRSRSGKQKDVHERALGLLAVRQRSRRELERRLEGAGFDPEEIADPLAPENLLKASGRGIFFMKSFMDDVTLKRAAEGGMEVRMVKKLATGA